MKQLTRWLAAAWLAGPLAAGEFFAMDTGISGDPVEVARVIEETGFDGWGGSGDTVAATAVELEKRGRRLFNAYRVIAFGGDGPVITPELRGLIGELGRHKAALWVAISEVKVDGVAVVGTAGDAVAAAGLREIVSEARKSGVMVSLYPHAGYWMERFSDAGRLADEVEGAGVTFNLCHWLKVEGEVDPLPAMMKERERLQFVTVNGADGGETKSMGWERLIQPLGQGSYDTARLVRRLRREASWDGPVGLQGYGIGGDQKANLERSMSAWREIMGTAEGSVVCGYQGWFRCEGDGSGLGWFHYAGGGGFEPGKAGIEIWPDMSELGPDERFPTPFRHADGSVAEVFSSVKEATVKRHFRWMRDYGIDGAYVQRFAVTARDERHRESMDAVLAHCRRGAVESGRKWALMYDLSGLKAGELGVVREDWERLMAEGRIDLNEGAYLWREGRPLVALWGFGFNDRTSDPEEWSGLMDFFQQQGCAVMLGVPCYWRTLDRDCVDDPRVLEVIAKAQVVSPWSVGRFGTPQDAAARVEPLLKGDVEWCAERGIGYLPVIFPGFSWHNMEKGRGREAEFDAIPRLGGRFLWSQAVAAKQAGAKSLYIAMFDELDEATAVFKTSTNPPEGASPFLREEGIAADHYLWLSGETGRWMRGNRGPELPVRGDDGN